jgi:hypothetical protein
MDVLVFKTSVASPTAAAKVAPVLDAVAGKGQWNFALDDCDKILRVTSPFGNAELTIFVMNEMGFECGELED